MLFGPVVGELAQCFGGGDADAHGYADVFEDGGSNCSAPGLVIADAELAEIEEGLVYAVEFYVRRYRGKECGNALRYIPVELEVGRKHDKVGFSATLSLSKGLVSYRD